MLVLHSDNGISLVNEVKMRRTQLLLGFVTTFGGSTISAFNQAHSAWPSSVGRCNEY